MNHTLSETYNIDTIIQYIQTKLYTGLIDVWGAKLDGYGRVYRNDYKGSIIPEVFNASTKKYDETLFRKQSCFFFIDSTSHDLVESDNEEEFEADVKIVFMLKLTDVKTSSERVDADVKRDVVSILRSEQDYFSITGYEQTVEQVFRGFNTDKIINNDMHPLHVFAITGKIQYLITDKCD